MINIGALGENAAQDFLKKQKYIILARNYRTRDGEIDIVAYRRGVLVFAEVKTRTGNAFGAPKDAVDDEKIARCMRARQDLISNYLKNGRIPVAYRFFTLKRRVFKIRNDIFEVYAAKNGEIQSINHIKDAF